MDNPPGPSKDDEQKESSDKQQENESSGNQQQNESSNNQQENESSDKQQENESSDKQQENESSGNQQENESSGNQQENESSGNQQETENEMDTRGEVSQNSPYLIVTQHLIEDLWKHPDRARFKKKKKRKDVIKLEEHTDDHLISISECCLRYNTDPDKGLDQQEAIRRLEADGLNELTPPKITPQFVIFCKHMFSGFAIILWLSVVLCFLAYGIEGKTIGDLQKKYLYLAVIMLLVVVMAGIILYVQDRTSSSILESFKKMATHSAVVIRHRRAVCIPSEFLVQGDIVLINFGNKVPADVRIIENHGMKVDNSTVTGETEPQIRDIEPTSENPMETQNLAFYSTNVIEGTCKAIVLEVGDKTVIGKLASLTVGLKRADSPMTVEIRHFVKLITIVALGLSTFFIIIALALGNAILDCVIYFIALVVANIPEGLHITVTLCLTLSAKKMAKINCRIKCLDSVETLGSTSTICSDKTGTLTQNRMTVMEIAYNYKIYGIKYGLNRSTTVENEFDVKDPDFVNLMRCGRLCLRAQFEYSQAADGTEPAVLDRVVEGDASEAGILKCVECIFGGVDSYREDNPKLMEIPFNSTDKYQLSIHRTPTGNVLFMKGAPEKVLDLCSTVSVNGQTVKLTDETRKKINELLYTMGGKGERVLGFCDMELSDPPNTVYSPVEKNYPTSNLRFVGLMALVDPPREAVPDAVARCKTAGIRVIMVTGDHPVTAEAIARKVGIISGDTLKDAAERLKVPPESVPQSEVQAIVVSGERLREMTPDELDEVLLNHEEIVFARTTPTQKLLIVEGCQRLGYITAVTGDGVNDSPALKKADIGVAMGIAGHEVSKQAADLVLLDDNFASIVTGVEQGRIIFENLKKSIAYVLTSNLPEMAPFIAYILLDVPKPLTVIAVLIVDIGTDMVPAISLAYERAESDIMKRKPRNPFHDKMVNLRLIWMAYGHIGMIQAVAAFIAYFQAMAQYGFFPMDLLGIREDWENEAVFVTDSYGQQWDYHGRRSLERYCQSCYFAAIVVTQLADVVICKTRRNSIIHQHMTNWVLNGGMIFALGIACFVLYCPGVSTFLELVPIRLVHWLPGVPFAVLIIVFDETRRYIIRHRPGGWGERELYY